MKNLTFKQQTFHEFHLYYSDQKMEHITWSNSYSLGIKLIDDQHRKILDFAYNLLNYNIKNEEEEEAYFRDLIAEVVEYIKVHFATEEGIMLAIQFPGYAEHKRTHENLILTVVRSIKDYESGNRLVPVNFSNFLRKWILTHIAVMDLKYIDYCKKINIKL